ncbi:MAG: C-terminal binding protein, partial [Vulcanimicrobiaceae bacterium]
MSTVVITDFPWPDTAIEQQVIGAAGHRLIVGQPKPGGADETKRSVAEHDPDAILVAYAPITAEVLAAAPRLRHVAKTGIGIDNIALDAATQRGVLVTNVPDYCIEEVSDHALALMLAFTRQIAHFDREVKNGAWGIAAGGLRRTNGLTVGVLGFGRIGRATVRKAHALGADVLAYDVMPVQDSGAATMASLDETLQRSDVVILHMPLDPSTQHAVNGDFIARMKRGAILINVSRGPLVDNDAILQGLESGQLGGVGLDVIEGEPNPPRALVERDDVIVTPHVAYA